MTVVKCFGIAKEIILKDQFILQPNSYGTIGDLRKWLNAEYPKLATIKGFMLSLNHEYATDDQEITMGDEIAIIPPVSGG